jgi:hypothetical protein
VNQTRHELGFADLADDGVVAIRGERIGTPARDISAPGGEPVQESYEKRGSADL